MNELGVFLRKVRKEAGITQDFVAKQLNLNRSTYSKYELGQSNPNIVTLLKIAKLLNVPCLSFLNVINKELGLKAPLS